jgi:hypothetical protein
MKKPAFTLMVLWSYLLVVSYYGLDSYSGTGMKDLGAWQLMLASAAIVPMIALAVISGVNSSSGENNAALEFVALNKKQLKTYGLGVLLLIAIFGGLIMVAAVVWGVLVNAFLFVTALVKKHG